ncbi:DNA-directed RNA polymerase III RPC4, putative [Talaromyces stipitatus ATCC 10500]|uniref:DNA-directed RNA polymerase III RPC4, putative n=1 Tax=Talaromyces stipitatus (strain ATCC 10500 / CBS 375.48 / QM 6759 / NRRL 1006) TaxID=441959 RepID=B8MPZ6_TALSN|nr:DNA-directed RNA polymerase III RPC4, putative [Talaromyces stipitatus ATCC 10500]EED12886.1 DNA-directed RNA polymerase III RPC4, putative [Talaromyces stipitatus ATCC 10500]
MPPKAAGRGAARRPALAGSTEDTANTASSSSSSTAPSARPPVQRLQSLNRRTPGGSIGPRGGSLSRGELGGPTKPALKFAPRSANRRAKEERDALIELEAERNRQRLSEAEAIQRARLGNAPRARGRGGRGGVMFGGPGGFKRGRGGRFENDSRSSPALRHTLSRSHTPAHWRSNNNGGYSSDENEQASALRISIDEINLDDSSEDEEDSKDAKGKKAVKKLAIPLRGPRPIRVERHEHEERIVSVDVDASTSIAAEPSRKTLEEEESDNELFISEDPATPKVKREPTDGDLVMADVPHAEDLDETPLPAQRVKARKSVVVKDPRSLLRTKEEIEEFDRHNEDLETLKDILTPDEPVTVEKQATTTEGECKGDGGKAEEEVKEEETVDKNAGRLYLIQFPPLTPNLTVPGEAEPLEVQDNVATEDVTVVQENPTQGLGDIEVKREEDQEEKVNVAKKPAGKLVTATQRQLPAGRVGRLHLHKSGRVTLDWGGISFELDKGANVNFVQEAVIASTPSTMGAGEEDTGERSVWSMGQLSEKFVASPEWNKLTKEDFFSLDVIQFQLSLLHSA